MEAEELQIGDWVYCNPSYFNDDYNGVTEFPDELQHYKIERGEDMEETGCYSPIPLTAEILEKNGFIGKEEEHYYSYHIRYGRLGNDIFDVHYQNHWIACSTPDNRNEFALFGMIVLRYVHELQHALRLCGLTELADNFIV